MTNKPDAEQPMDLLPILIEAASDDALSIGRAWNLLSNAADEIERLRQVVLDAKRREEVCLNVINLHRPELERLRANQVPQGYVAVPKIPSQAMLNAMIDVDNFKLGDISPLGFRCSPQQLFRDCYRAMIAVVKP